MIPSSTMTGIFLWFLRSFLTCLFCLLIGIVGIKILDKITVKIHEFKAIRGHALSTSLFVGGFLIFAGLVVHGSFLNPIFFGQQLMFSSFINFGRFLVVLLSVFVTLVLGWIFYLVFAQVKLFDIDLDDINKSPIAVGCFIFCYEIFMGLVIHASLSVPL